MSRRTLLIIYAQTRCRSFSSRERVFPDIPLVALRPQIRAGTLAVRNVGALAGALRSIHPVGDRRIRG